MQYNIRDELSRFLAEDIGRGDITGMFVPHKKIRAGIISRQAGMIAGMRFAGMIFALVGCRARSRVKDGSSIIPNQTVMNIYGDVRAILAAERTALNLLSRMSGIATQANTLASGLPPGVRLYATRKTAPGLRFFDKEAVAIGGGRRHRMALDKMVMFKDNHLAAGPGIAEMISAAKKRHGKVEIEVENGNDAIVAVRAGASVVMLDNFTTRQIRNTVLRLKRLGLRDRVRLEASGSITAKNIDRYADTGVDMISSGSITNSVRAIDFSLEVESV